MKTSKKGRTFLGGGGLVALVALAVALCAQVAGAEAITGPGGQVLKPNMARHAARVPRKAGPVAPGVSRTITVTTTADGGPGSLRQAIAEAQPGDTIVLPEGTYVLTHGELEIDKALTIAGSGPARTTIDGAGDARGFLIRVPFGTNAPVTISGVTITHARAALRIPEFETFDGAAIASFNADLTLRNDVITHNRVKLETSEFVFGGAVLANFGRFTMIDTTVSENVTSVGEESAVFGGAVGVEGVESTLIENSRILANRTEIAGSGFSFVVGGGMRIVGFGQVQVSGSAVSGNVAEAPAGFVVGGGMHVVGEPTKIVGDQVVSNLASAGGGSAEGGGLSFSGLGGVIGSLLEANGVRGAERIGGNFLASAGFLLDEREVIFSQTSVLHGFGRAGSENCATVQEATILSKGFNRESTDQCGFHAEGDEVNVP